MSVELSEFSLYLYILVNATALGSLIRPRAVTRYNLAVSDMYMRVFGKTHQIAYTYCSVGISDHKPLAGTSEDQLLHRKSRPLCRLRAVPSESIGQRDVAADTRAARAQPEGVATA